MSRLPWKAHRGQVEGKGRGAATSGAKGLVLVGMTEPNTRGYVIPAPPLPMAHILQIVTGSINTGSGNTEPPHLMDISKLLTKRFGRLIRQGHVFRVSRINVHLLNGAGQSFDFGAQARGTIRWFSPTKGRVKAWRYALAQHVQARKSAQAPRTGDYDFRCTLDAGGSFATSPVDGNAWFSDPTAYVGLVGHEQFNPAGSDRTVSRGIFNTHNSMLAGAGAAAVGDMGNDDLPTSSFGGPHIIDQDDDLDDDDGSNNLVMNETDFYTVGEANETFDYLRWNAGTTAFTEGGFANHQVSIFEWDTPIDVMCGLLSIDIEQMSRDAQVANDNFYLQLTLAVDGWTPLVSRKKTMRRRKK